MAKSSGAVKKERRLALKKEQEMRRKTDISDLIKQIGDLVPKDQLESKNQKDILRAAYDYVMELKGSVEKVSAGDIEHLLVPELKRLKRQIDNLKKQCLRYEEILTLIGISKDQNVDKLRQIVTGTGKPIVLKIAPRPPGKPQKHPTDQATIREPDADDGPNGMCCEKATQTSRLPTHGSLDSLKGVPMIDIPTAVSSAVDIPTTSMVRGGVEHEARPAVLQGTACNTRATRAGGDEPTGETIVAESSGSVTTAAQLAADSCVSSDAASTTGVDKPVDPLAEDRPAIIRSGVSSGCDQNEASTSDAVSSSSVSVANIPVVTTCSSVHTIEPQTTSSSPPVPNSAASRLPHDVATILNLSWPKPDPPAWNLGLILPPTVVINNYISSGRWGRKKSRASTAVGFTTLIPKPIAPRPVVASEDDPDELGRAETSEVRVEETRRLLDGDHDAGGHSVGEARLRVNGSEVRHDTPLVSVAGNSNANLVEKPTANESVCDSLNDKEVHDTSQNNTLVTGKNAECVASHVQTSSGVDNGSDDVHPIEGVRNGDTTNELSAKNPLNSGCSSTALATSIVTQAPSLPTPLANVSCTERNTEITSINAKLVTTRPIVETPSDSQDLTGEMALDAFEKDDSRIRNDDLLTKGVTSQKRKLPKSFVLTPVTLSALQSCSSTTDPGGHSNTVLRTGRSSDDDETSSSLTIERTQDPELGPPCAPVAPKRSCSFTVDSLHRSCFEEATDTERGTVDERRRGGVVTGGSDVGNMSQWDGALPGARTNQTRNVIKAAGPPVRESGVHWRGGGSTTADESAVTLSERQNVGSRKGGYVVGNDPVGSYSADGVSGDIEMSASTVTAASALHDNAERKCGQASAQSVTGDEPAITRAMCSISNIAFSAGQICGNVRPRVSATSVPVATTTTVAVQEGCANAPLNLLGTPGTSQARSEDAILSSVVSLIMQTPPKTMASSATVSVTTLKPNYPQSNTVKSWAASFLDETIVVTSIPTTPTNWTRSPNMGPRAAMPHGPAADYIAPESVVLATPSKHQPLYLSAPVCTPFENVSCLYPPTRQDPTWFADYHQTGDLLPGMMPANFIQPEDVGGNPLACGPGHTSLAGSHSGDFAPTVRQNQPTAFVPFPPTSYPGFLCDDVPSAETDFGHTVFAPTEQAMSFTGQPVPAVLHCSSASQPFSHHHIRPPVSAVSRAFSSISVAAGGSVPVESQRYFNYGPPPDVNPRKPDRSQTSFGVSNAAKTTNVVPNSPATQTREKRNKSSYQSFRIAHMLQHCQLSPQQQQQQQQTMPVAQSHQLQSDVYGMPGGGSSNAGWIPLGPSIAECNYTGLNGGQHIQQLPQGASNYQQDAPHPHKRPAAPAILRTEPVVTRYSLKGTPLSSIPARPPKELFRVHQHIPTDARPASVQNAIHDKAIDPSLYHPTSFMPHNHQYHRQHSGLAVGGYSVSSLHAAVGPPVYHGVDHRTLLAPVMYHEPQVGSSQHVVTDMSAKRNNVTSMPSIVGEGRGAPYFVRPAAYDTVQTVNLDLQMGQGAWPPDVASGGYYRPSESGVGSVGFSARYLMEPTTTAVARKRTDAYY